MGKYKINDILKGTISGVTSYGIFVKIDDDYCGLIHISEISNSYIKYIDKLYSVGMVIYVKILDINEKNHQMKLSIKQIHCSEKSDISKIPEIGNCFSDLEHQLPFWTEKKYQEILEKEQTNNTK